MCVCIYVTKALWSWNHCSVAVCSGEGCCSCNRWGSESVCVQVNRNIVGHIILQKKETWTEKLAFDWTERKINNNAWLCLMGAHTAHMGGGGWNIVSGVRGSVTNNNGFWIRWLDLLTLNIYTARNYRKLQHYRYSTHFHSSPLHTH
jgi:hypothetical protein